MQQRQSSPCFGLPYPMTKASSEPKRTLSDPNSCASTEFNATGALKLHTRGCLDSDLCNKTLTGSILTAAYTGTFTCCTKDLCNSASSMHLSIAVGPSSRSCPLCGSHSRLRPAKV
uniref:UPAR/Ly6 domain-containing protein n=1 Tax=Neogobius melanostomus TaxID=47308 RepID=A0A8C6V709_9GOBI